MPAFRRAILLVVVAGIGLSVYFFFFSAVQPVQAFDAVLNLTPGELELHCGMPTLDTVGVVADGAGIRDLHYSASGNGEVVFRFISTDEKSWQSLGAWDRVRTPDFLGSPIDAQEAGRVMGCVTKEDSRAFVRPLERGVYGELSPAQALAVFASPQAIQEMMMPGQHQGPPPMPSTLPPGAAARGESHSGPAVVRVPESDWSQAPKAYYDTDDDDLPHFRSVPRCPPGSGACEMLDYPEFVDLMKQVIAAERQDNFAAAADRLTQRGLVMVRLPANEQSRVEASKNVIRLEVRAFNIVEERLRDDVTRLEPHSGDSADKAAKKIAEMRREDNLRRALWCQAIEANGPARAASSSGETMRLNTGAYRRMVQIHVSGVWR